MRDSERILIEIYQFPTDERLNDERELVYSHQGNVQDVCATFHETFTQLYEDRETDEFEFNWHQPFPFAEFEKFRNDFKSRLTATDKWKKNF